MTHGIEVPDAKTLEELGTQLGQLRYDALFVVLRSLGDELLRQAEEDMAGGKIQLHRMGDEAVDHLVDCSCQVADMLRVSIPYMLEDIRNRPLLVDPNVIT